MNKKLTITPKGDEEVMTEKKSVISSNSEISNLLKDWMKKKIYVI